MVIRILNPRPSGVPYKLLGQERESSTILMLRFPHVQYSSGVSSATFFKTRTSAIARASGVSSEALYVS